ncbi:uncharacterized protein LOC102356528 [Latimeria chalumnae]|uniref:GOLD domain-containing protein n=1 Tax=Latimeria chalumnae TaxID=7897 RepID=M3XJY9_LATCH|nr:PREDICTED: uncharacterized protein LOC102356528 [Latimeria chalumnae]XP_014350754.1 PREDICTED: uncharacterized protein LOC102356528 [Latimeria chalumnae]|eukprot:XP_006007244.1 PREDICTED: uncharacterized protein LOC102356528 [Latimeria chalumnae]
MGSHLGSSLSLVLVLVVVSGREVEQKLPRVTRLTVLIPSGKDSCAYVPLRTGDEWSIYYEVMKDEKHAVSFFILSPSHKFLVSEYGNFYGRHSLQIFENGDHMMCFEQPSFSNVEKVVNFHIMVKSQGNHSDPFGNRLFPPKYVHMKTKLKYMRDSLQTVKFSLQEIQHLQKFLRYFLLHDDQQQERNGVKVNLWSAITTVLSMLVATAQVFTIKYVLVGKEAATCFP